MFKVDPIVYVNFVMYFEMMYHLYFRRFVNFVLQTNCNLTVDDPIFALIFCEKTRIFWNLLCLFCLKLISPSEIIFTNDEYVFLKILVSNLRVLCFDIYAIPTMCTPYYQSRLDLVSEICLVNILTFRYEVSLLYFSTKNLLRVLTYVCRHCNIKCF